MTVFTKLKNWIARLFGFQPELDDSFDRAKRERDEIS